MPNIGHAGGWWSSWGNAAGSMDAVTTPGTTPISANREFVDVNFPCNLEVKKFRVQGIPTITVGGGEKTGVA